MKNYIDKEGRKTEEALLRKVKVTILGEPSAWYVENILEPMQPERAQRKQNFEYQEKLIKKMKEIALRELEKEEQNGR